MLKHIRTLDYYMETIVQKADRIMQEKSPCTIILSNGHEINCDQITYASLTIIGSNRGTITILENKSSRVISLEEISCIR